MSCSGWAFIFRSDQSDSTLACLYEPPREAELQGFGLPCSGARLWHPRQGLKQGHLDTASRPAFCCLFAVIWDLWNGKCRAPGQDVESLQDRTAPLFLTELACVCMSTSSLQKIHCRTGSLCGLWKPQCSLNPGTSIYATSTHLLLRTNSQKQLVPHLFLSPSFSCSRKEFRDNTDAAKTYLLS